VRIYVSSEQRTAGWRGGGSAIEGGTLVAPIEQTNSWGKICGKGNKYIRWLGCPWHQEKSPPNRPDPAANLKKHTSRRVEPVNNPAKRRPPCLGLNNIQLVDAELVVLVPEGVGSQPAFGFTLIFCLSNGSRNWIAAQDKAGVTPRNPTGVKYLYVSKSYTYNVSVPKLHTNMRRVCSVQHGGQNRLRAYNTNVLNLKPLFYGLKNSWLEYRGKTPLLSRSLWALTVGWPPARRRLNCSTIPDAKASRNPREGYIFFLGKAESGMSSGPLNL